MLLFFKLFLIKIGKIWRNPFRNILKISCAEKYEKLQRKHPWRHLSKNSLWKIWHLGLHPRCFPKNIPNLSRATDLRNTCNNWQMQSPEVFCKKGVLKSFSKFTGKLLCQSLVSNKVAGLRPATLLKKRPWYRCFPVNFEKFKNIYFEEHQRTALSELILNYLQIFELHTFSPIVFMRCFPRNYILRGKFGDFLVRIFPHSDQKNSEFRHFSRSDYFLKCDWLIPLLLEIWLVSCKWVINVV